MHKWFYLTILFTCFWFTVCDQNFLENITEYTTIRPNGTTETLLKKIKHGNKHLPKNVTTKTHNYKKRHKQVQLRMVTLCQTPNNDEGFCLPLSNCTKLMSQLENKNARKFLRESRCGPKNENSNDPRVCCGNYDNYKHLGLKKENLFPKICGFQNVSVKARIFGGKEAALGEFPWMARLIHKDKRNVKTFGCSGFLITSKFVLTAAHCLKSDNLHMLGPIFEVQFGEHNTDFKIDCNSKNTTCADPPQVIRIQKNIVHPNYSVSSSDHHNDIGLIHLKKAVTITNYVSPICLISNYDFEPFEYWISGWGSTKNISISPIKLKVSLPPYQFSNCTQKYKLVNIEVIDNQICAGGKKNKDSCTGDSGGPLMVVRDKNHWFAAGIVSFGLGCGREGWPGIYTNITSYLPWIQKTILRRVTSDSNSN